MTTVIRPARCVAAVALIVIPFILSACGGPGAEVLAEGLVAPRGLGPGGDGGLLVTEVGEGRLLEISGGEPQTLMSGLPASLDAGPGGNYPAGASAVIEDGDGYHILVSEFQGDRFSRLYRAAPDGDLEPLTAPVGIDIAAAGRLSNPYDFIEAVRFDGWLVSDSGRNHLLAVGADGATRDYARLPDIEAPGRDSPAEPVPTGIARGPDGAAYVGGLTGYPYPSGGAAVWRVEDRNGDGDAFDPGEVEVVASGFAPVTDVTFDDEGGLYVAEFTSDMNGVIAARDISAGVHEFRGRVLKLARGADGGYGEPEPVAEGLVSPTGILVVGDRLVVAEEFAGRVRSFPLD